MARTLLRLFLVGAAAAVAVACGDDGGSDVDADLDAAHADRDLEDGTRPDWYVPDAAPAVCGDGVTEGSEVCDDGNTLSGDGCNSTCTLEDGWDMVASYIVDGDQNEPAVSCTPDLAAAVWTDWGGADGDGAAVRLRLFQPDGRPAETILGHDREFVANVTAAAHQYQPAVAIAPSGRIIAVWTDGSGASGGGNDIRMQLFESDGTRYLQEILVNTTTQADQQTPAVAVESGGTILAIWADGSAAGPDTSAYGIRGRLFDQDGTPITNAQTLDASDFQINQVTNAIQRDPAVCPNGSGGFLVVWSDASGVLDTDGYGVVGTLLDTSGSFFGPGTDFLVNSTTAGHQLTPSAALQPLWGPAVVWTDASLTEDLWESGIRGRLLNMDGSFRANHTGGDADFQINTTYDSAQELPVVTSDPDGKLLAVWQDWGASDGSGGAIRGRAMQTDGAPATFSLSPDGNDFPVNITFLGTQRSPAACNLGLWYMALWTDESHTPPDDQGDAVRYRLIPGW